MSRSPITTEVDNDQDRAARSSGPYSQMELDARELSGSALARALRVSPNRITKILTGERAVTAETAMRLGRYFDNSPRFWMNLQTNYDLERATREKGDRIKAEVLAAE